MQSHSTKSFESCSHDEHMLGSVNDATSLSGTAQESLSLAFCLATRRCKNLGPSFLEPSTPSYRNISQT